MVANRPGRPRITCSINVNSFFAAPASSAPHFGCFRIHVMNSAAVTENPISRPIRVNSQWSPASRAP